VFLRRDYVGKLSNVAQPKRGSSGVDGCMPRAKGEVRVLNAQGIGASEISRRLEIGRASVYRLLG